MPIAVVDMIKLLKAHGFKYIRANGSHRLYKNPYTGKQTIVPYHSGTLKPGTERRILKQAGLK